VEKSSSTNHFKIYHKDSFKNNLEGSVKWKSPSNIALVKYWGKYGVQLPRNASLSFTLQNAHTITSVNYSPKDSAGISLSFKFEDQSNPAFEHKINKFLSSIISYLPFLENVHLDIESSNSFPHSSGIASSASAMSALIMCLIDIEAKIIGQEINEEAKKKASYLSRLGSGSASRSVIPKFGFWGYHEKVANTSNEYAIEITDLHPVFSTFHDDILIVSDKEKSVSSTAGHALMNNIVYATSRYQQANDHLEELISAMKDGNLEVFGTIVENEALTLHALMMCSNPSYILMEPGTLDMIREIRNFRKNTSLPVYFTLDAGPNIHLLYPDHIKSEIDNFIQQTLMPYTSNNVIIKDVVGNGPEKLV